MWYKSNVFRIWAQAGMGGRSWCPLSGLQRNPHPTPGRGKSNSFNKTNPRPRRAVTASDIRLVQGLVFTFALLLHKVQDGDGPIRAPQEPRDALHHPFHLVLFFRSHPAHTGRRGCLGQTPPARSSLSAAGSGPQSPGPLLRPYKPVNVKWSL